MSKESGMNFAGWLFKVRYFMSTPISDQLELEAINFRRRWKDRGRRREGKREEEEKRGRMRKRGRGRKEDIEIFLIMWLKIIKKQAGESDNIIQPWNQRKL